MNRTEQNLRAVRNGEIDLWKFIFSILIVVHHSSYLPVQAERTYFHGGSIGVEFFFIVSGFYLAKSAERIVSYDNLAKETLGFLKKKLSKIYPYMIPSFFIAILAKSAFQNRDLLGYIKNSVLGLEEILLLKSTGLLKESFNSPTWYLSAMICAMLILFPLVLKYRKTFTHIVCPLVSAFLLGYLLQKYGQFRTPDQWDGLFVKGMIRAVAEIAFGIVCYEICRKLSEYRFTPLSKAIFTVIEYGGLIAIIAYSNTESCWDMDAPSVLLMGAAVIIAGGNMSLLSDFWSRLPVVPWLGKFSLMLYLNHIYWVWIFAILDVRLAYPQMCAAYVGCACISALIDWKVTDWVIAAVRKNGRKLRALFIEMPRY